MNGKPTWLDRLKAVAVLLIIWLAFYGLIRLGRDMGWVTPGY